MSGAAFEYKTNITVERAAERLRAAERILVTTHSKPDGDAVGSVLAVARAMEQLGKWATIWIMPPLEEPLRIVIGSTKVTMIEKPGEDDFDLIVVVDTGSFAQLEAIAEWLKARREKILGIDHHRGGEAVAEERIVEGSAASTTMVLMEVLDRLGVRMDGTRGGIAEALFVGLATDTGWFKYSNADARAFEAAGRLLRTGVNKSVLYEILEETYPPQRLAIQARAMASVEYFRKGSVAVQTVRMSDLKETRTKSEDLTGLVNEPMVVGSVRVSILVAQFTAGVTKLSFRSKPRNPDAGTSADDLVDVNALAKQFGGGGHVHAAGARLNLDIDDARKKIIEAVR